MSELRLDLGSLDLVNADIGAHDYWFETLADGYSLGAPEAVLVVAASLMRDGDDERIDRYGNREVTFTVAAKGPDLAALAEAERVLTLELGRRNELRVTPPDGYGATTVFDVLTSSMTPVMDDLAEVRDGIKERRYTLTLRCEPFGRSATPVTQSLTPTTMTLTKIDDCVSLDNWSATGTWGGNGNPLSVTIEGSGANTETVIAGTRHNMFPGERRTEHVLWSGAKPTTPYIALDVWGSPEVTLGGNAPTAVGSVQYGIYPVRTYRRLYFANPGGSAPYDFHLAFYSSDGNAQRVRFANLFAAAGAPGGIQTVEALGSVRAPGSVTATRATDMTWLFLYSDPMLLQTGFSPALYNTWAAGLDGTYVIYARNWGAAGDALSLTVTDAAGRPSTATTRLKANPPTWRPIGEVQLGGFRSGEIGELTLSGTVNSSASTPSTQDLRLFRRHVDTALTYVNGIAANTVELATPSLDLPRGGLWADDVACFDKAVAWDFPLIVPPMTALYVEANDSTTAPVSTTVGYYPRSHTYSSV